MEMWFCGGATTTFIRNFCRKAAPNLRKINPKVPPQEASAIAESLYLLLKQHGPLTVSNTWNHVKEAGVGGLNSKTHMKIMLKWMRGRKMLKLFCHHVGSNKKFLHCTLPEESLSEQSKAAMDLKLLAEKPAVKRRKQKKL